MLGGTGPGAAAPPDHSCPAPLPLPLTPAVLAELSDIVDLPERAAAVEELMQDDTALVGLGRWGGKWGGSAGPATGLAMCSPPLSACACICFFCWSKRRPSQPPPSSAQVRAYEGLTVLEGTATNVKEAWRR
jgi:hypothetical protein